nr:hypothetical protein [Tanacetum cinerariifolium]
LRIASSTRKEDDVCEYEDDISEDIEVKDKDGEIRDYDLDEKKTPEVVGKFGDDEVNNSVDMFENLAANVGNKMPVPFSENAILNPSVKGVSEVRNEGSSVKGNRGK